MSLIAYTLFDRITGDIPHSGTRQEEHLPEATDTHDVLIGQRLSPNTQRVDPATRQPLERAVSKRDEWRASRPAPEPTEEAVVLEALKAKLTPAELAAARQKLRSARGIQGA